MIQFFWLFLGIAVILAVVAGFLKLLRNERAAEILTKISTALIVGTLIAFNTIILLVVFEQTTINPYSIIAFLLISGVLIGLYRSNGPGVIYVVTIFVIIFGYFFTGPYSGYIRTYTKGVVEPLSVAVYSARAAGHDLFLLLTDPQAYIAEKQLKRVKTEETTSYPMGIEFAGVYASPEAQFSGRQFFVQVVAENKGGLKARDLFISAECYKRCEEAEGTDIITNKTKDGEILKYWKGVFSFGPFVTLAQDRTDIGRTADVKVTMSYFYSTVSTLLVKIMNETEIQNRLMKGDLNFELGVATGKISPTMLALSVGRQPLYAGEKNYLLISIVNKHMDARTVLVPGVTRLEVKLPSDVFYDVDCDYDKSRVNLVKEELGEYTLINISFKERIVIPAVGESDSSRKPYYFFTCTLITRPVEIEKETSITGKLINYEVEVKKIVGPQIMDSGYWTTFYSYVNGICVNDIEGALIKEKCGCDDSACEKDVKIPGGCADNRGDFSDWNLDNSICIEGDSKRFSLLPDYISCCPRPGAKKGGGLTDKRDQDEKLGQCLKIDLVRIAESQENSVENLTDIWIRVDAESSKCNNDLMIYGCYKSECREKVKEDWSIISGFRDIDGSGPKIIHITSEDLSDMSKIRAIDVCSNPDIGQNCDHKIDWVIVKFKEGGES